MRRDHDLQQQAREVNFGWRCKSHMDSGAMRTRVTAGDFDMSLADDGLQSLPNGRDWPKEEESKGIMNLSQSVVGGWRGH